MNKLEKRLKGHYKFIKRLKNLNLLGEIHNPLYKLHSYKSHGKPCSCYLCKNKKFKRKIKHKNYGRK